jgi:hypothetical protein
MENITCELNGIKYLLVETPIVQSSVDELKGKCKKHGAIYQGVSKIDRGGFFSSPYMIVKILVPEKNVIAWNNDDK